MRRQSGRTTMGRQVGAGLVALGVVLLGACSQPAATPAAQPEAAPVLDQARAAQVLAEAVARAEAATGDGGENLNQLREDATQRKLLLADTDGDGQQDAAVAVVRLANASGDYSESRVFGWRLTQGQLVELDTSGVALGPMGTVEVAGDQLSTELLMHAPEDAACCPSVSDTRSYTITADAIRDTSFDE